jgi:hypothetical protein
VRCSESSPLGPIFPNAKQLLCYSYTRATAAQDDALAADGVVARINTEQGGAHEMLSQLSQLRSRLLKSKLAAVIQTKVGMTALAVLLVGGAGTGLAVIATHGSPGQPTSSSAAHASSPAPSSKSSSASTHNNPCSQSAQQSRHGPKGRGADGRNQSIANQGDGNDQGGQGGPNHHKHQNNPSQCGQRSQQGRSEDAVSALASMGVISFSPPQIVA